MLLLFFFFFPSLHCQTIKQLNEISIKEELPIGSIVTYLTDKIPNLEQSLEYDLVTPLSSDLDLFSIDHSRHTLNIKQRLDYEEICSKKLSHSCVISISIAVSNHDTIHVYILPIQIENIDDNPMKFSVNRTTIEIEENDSNWSKKTYALPSAIDADGDFITYSLYLQNWNKINGLFEFDEQNFLLKPLKAFDREEQNLYLLRLVAHNQHGKDLSTDIIILIKDQNDNSPRCQSNQTLFLIHNINAMSTFIINATDPDEGDNARLEYQFVHPQPGFTIDRDQGQITFDYTKWIRGNPSKFAVKITDYGKPIRLSTECLVEFQFTSVLDIHFQSNAIIHIEHLNSSIGQLIIMDKQEQRACRNCSIHFNSSLQDIFSFDEKNNNLYLNFHSMILVRILSNYIIKQESLPVMINIDVWDRNNPSIISSKNYSLIINFNKEKILHNTNTFFLRIPETILLNETIVIFNNQYHPCLTNPSTNWKLIDPTHTFELDEQFRLIIKKYLHIQQQETYQLFLRNNQTNPCSLELRIFIYNPYSSQKTFYILTSRNLSSFVLPSLPSHVKYISSKSNDIAIDQDNGSMTIRSSTLYSTYAYDFHIQTIDSQTPSLSCSIPIRIFFGINQQSPRLLHNDTQQSLDMSSREFIYQIEAYDPDLAIDKTVVPIIEYQIESSDELEIDRYTGRIYFQNVNRSRYEFTVILTDFGQPNRLITREKFLFDFKSTEPIPRHQVSMLISRTFMLITAGLVTILILFTLIIIIYNSCSRPSSSSSTAKSLANLSPTTPDCRLIDNEYITTTTSLPRVMIREQRIYPDHPGKLLEQIHLPPSSLSINDINKYLARFEKIYNTNTNTNNNSSEQYFREPVGSVV